LCGICRYRRARISFAHFGGTAVSARQTEFALESETHNGKTQKRDYLQLTHLQRVRRKSFSTCIRPWRASARFWAWGWSLVR